MDVVILVFFSTFLYLYTKLIYLIQVYESSQKLAIDLQNIEVTRGDFDRALRKIVPSTHRVEDKILSPLPKHVKPLLETTHLALVANLKRMFPHSGVGKGAILPKTLTHRKIFNFFKWMTVRICNFKSVFGFNKKSI